MGTLEHIIPPAKHLRSEKKDRDRNCSVPCVVDVDLNACFWLMRATCDSLATRDSWSFQSLLAIGTKWMSPIVLQRWLAPAAFLRYCWVKICETQGQLRIYRLHWLKKNFEINFLLASCGKGPMRRCFPAVLSVVFQRKRLNCQNVLARTASICFIGAVSHCFLSWSQV